MAKKTREVTVLEGFGIVELTRGFRARVDERHAVWASQWNWRLHAQGSVICGGGRYLHREILKLEGHTLEGQDVVAMDGNYLNCVMANLRVDDRKRVRPPVTHRNTTGFKGVHFDSKSRKWHARIQLAYERNLLGAFDTAEEASAAYEKAAEAQH